MPNTQPTQRTCTAVGCQNERMLFEKFCQSHLTSNATEFAEVNTQPTPFNLKLCQTCSQMTNHIGNVCQKHAKDTQPPTSSKDITKAKVLHILKTHITIAEGADPDEVYAKLITEHIHRHFVLKELLDVANQ